MDCTIDKLTSEISPPLLFDASKEIISAFESGNPASSYTSFVNDSLFPAKTICA